MLQYSAMRTQPKMEKGRTSGIYITDSESDSKILRGPVGLRRVALGLEDGPRDLSSGNVSSSSVKEVVLYARSRAGA